MKTPKKQKKLTSISVPKEIKKVSWIKSWLKFIRNKTKQIYQKLDSVIIEDEASLIYKKLDSVIIEDEAVKFFRKLNSVNITFWSSYKKIAEDKKLKENKIEEKLAKSVKKPAKKKKAKIKKIKVKKPLKIRVPKVIVPRKAKSESPISDFDLMNWSTAWYVDLKSGSHIYGKDILLNCLYSSSFWVNFAQYVGSLDAADFTNIWGVIPKCLWSFSFRIKKAWFDTNNPKNMCIWLWALNPKKALFCDEHGWLNAEGLKNWFNVGYVNPNTGLVITGKEILKSFYASQNFWDEIANYASTISLETTKEIGGKFPNWVSSFATIIKGPQKKHISIEEIFEWFGMKLADFAPIDNSKWYLSVEWLKKWSMEWYIEEKSKRRVYGKDILLQALYSNSFWKSFAEYVNNLSDEDIKSMWGKISANSTAYTGKMREVWYKNFSVKDLCVWLWAIDPKQSKFTDEFGNLSVAGLKRWYKKWYVDPITGNEITGRQIAIYAKSSDNFWKFMQKYSRLLEFRHAVVMGGKFPKDKTGLSERFFNLDTMKLQDFLKAIWNGKDTEYLQVVEKASKIKSGKAEKFLKKLFPES